MTATQVLITVIVLIVIAALGYGIWFVTRRRALQNRFGPEYDRLVEGGSRSKAERELAERERRHAELDIKALPEADRTRFADEWQKAQLSFLDDPTQAVREAGSLISKVMTRRGYPSTDDLAAQEAELSVEHARQLSNLRAAQAVSTAASSGEANSNRTWSERASTPPPAQPVSGSARSERSRSKMSCHCLTRPAPCSAPSWDRTEMIASAAMRASLAPPGGARIRLFGAERGGGGGGVVGPGMLGVSAAPFPGDLGP